jgi:hypothetical protein
MGYKRKYREGGGRMVTKGGREVHVTEEKEHYAK